MDISKVGPKSWSEPGLVPQSKDAVSGFKQDIHDGKVTNSIGDLLQLSRSRSNRQFMQTSVSTSALPAANKSGPSGGEIHRPELPKKSKVGQINNVFERPATRLEIDALNEELLERVKAVLEEPEATTNYATATAAVDPHRDAVALIRDRMMKEFVSDVRLLPNEPWLGDLIKCECLREVCDEAARRLTDMLAVTTTEFGNVMRTLRATYRQSFQQMRLSWEKLRSKHMQLESELQSSKNTVERLQGALEIREQDIRQKIDAEVFEMRNMYEKERAKDREHVTKVEHQMSEMAVTLRDLNALFKTMQGDADTAIASDTMARCRRLEKEVQDLELQVSSLGRAKEDLQQEQRRNRSLEGTVGELRGQVEELSATVRRQDETIANLMGREAMHNAEIDKLKKMAAEKAEKEEDLEFDQTATALLCIKCKKALDDLNNIRDAVLGTVKPSEKLMCQNFRILLPNLKGRRPSRDVKWVMRCMRGILTSKMREICALMPFGVAGDISGFPEFVYAWFDPFVGLAPGALAVGGPSTGKGSAANAALVKVSSFSAVLSPCVCICVETSFSWRMRPLVANCTFVFDNCCPFAFRCIRRTRTAGASTTASRPCLARAWRRNSFGR